ncbi:DNA-binding transcriptional regulator, XRE-family HTH domain [Butyrivibrio sp. ob235]|uniref:helix-turn-helix domain-containing protein n=1 Tax=Butyrivibrio sp. ob235 TaxID=1761780 RepID=UPI0008D1B21F|nr:helix-turn-helix transcriptional regulator [Butyrivibrio sp. ob235]SEL14707.1 DNA-binding transcriptional regulator, XRE-family HTH domain [Butyrivibrio sp. ob235]
MSIGKVIRKYRKEKGLTQEEMAIRLGVSTPAVNKWEKDNTLPDISLLVPIARLFGISTDELLSFKDDITDKEIDIFIKELDRRLKQEPFEDVFADAKKKIEEYPCNEKLKWQVAVVLNAARLLNEVDNSDQYDEAIRSWFSGLLGSEDLSIRKSAAESLFHYYCRKEDYQTAEKYLQYYSEDNPERKVLQANIFAKTGRISEAYVAYEELMLAEVNRLRIIMNALQVLCEEDGNLEQAHRVADANENVAKCFDMGVYQEKSVQLELAAYEKNVDETARIMEALIDNCASISDFTKSNLFSHLTFKQLGKDFYAELQAELIKRFCDEKTFGYMSGNIYWETLKDKSHKE